MNTDSTAKVTCKFCGLPIEVRDDLVVRGGFWRMFAIHGTCHSQEIDREKTLGYVTNLPTNSAFIKGLALSYPVFALLSIFTESFDSELMTELGSGFWNVPIIFAALSILLSVRSWWKFERKVPR